MEEMILAKAKELFLSYGLKSITMDDVAKSAGVSKKTIYQFFEDRNELLKAIVDDLIDQHSKLFTQCQEQADNAIHEVLLQATIPFNVWATVHPGFFFELEKSLPELWKRLELHREKILFPGILANLEKGKTEHLYRVDIDVLFTAEIRIHQLRNALNPRQFTERRVSVSQLAGGLTQFYLQSITTEKGKKILHKYLKNKNEKELDKKWN